MGLPGLPEDAFGDRFDLDCLPLPRAARGYAVQMLDTDTLLDSGSGEFLPVRSPQLSALFSSFDAAHAAAARWIAGHGIAPDSHALAIVPAGYDDTLQRHVLIYGVLCGQP
jgi:hypothetical protein